ncbi:uncharacterized protein LY89DRAFT_611580 [Mollisia scopiformis]|uniref:ABM domain-containing protein n=1 Tax=Mollisia scopiformis TaxID=149040 RepID=A0A194XHS6_MOLSC|nr:uncharacterized protein LY89DRAFT_611580 [Mollisia scopiformis]KUJ19770.1 hypothetical protein LY89DRAFT_611580 [Mollisia scopiformis]
MSSNMNIIVTLCPKSGKADRVVELLQGVAAYVKENEPQTLRYEISRQANKKTGDEEVIMVESYKDKAALNTHGSSETFKKFNKTLEDEGLIGAPAQFKFVRAAGGFSRL